MSRAVRSLAGRLLTFACAVVLVGVLATVAVPALLGLQRFVITGGSMTGSIPKGSVVYSRLTPVEALRVGDVITFHPPGMSEPVTHRIVAIEPGPNGRPAFRTKGDFNQAEDPWGPVVLNEPLQARCVFHVPYVGYLFAALAVRWVRVVFIGVPAALIAVSLLVSLWREAGAGAGAGAPVAEGADDGLPHDARSRA